MFTEKAQRVIDLAKGCASASGAHVLDLSALVAAIGKDVESSVLMADCLGLTTEQLRGRSPAPARVDIPMEKLPLAEAVRTVLGTARELAEAVPDRQHPGLIDVRHLVGALAITRDACILMAAEVLSRDDALARLAALVRRAARPPRKRLPTRPTQASRARRLVAKKRRGRVKRLRGGRPGAEDI